MIRLYRYRRIDDYKFFYNQNGNKQKHVKSIDVSIPRLADFRVTELEEAKLQADQKYLPQKFQT
jgi:hypothetical protein